MWTTIAYSETVTAAVVRQLLLAVPDVHLSHAGDNIIIPSLSYLLGYYGIGLDIQNVQLASPQLRRLALIDVAPVENTALPTWPPSIIIRPDSPLPLVEDESLNALAGNSNIGNQPESVIVWLSDGSITPVSGEIFTVLATATAPATAYAWDSAAMTLTQTLPVGNYQLVGARVEQANTIAYRFILIEHAWRPGGIAVIDIDKSDVNGSRAGMLGEWGTFSHLHLPSIEFFGDGTGGAALIYLDLIKVS